VAHVLDVRDAAAGVPGLFERQNRKQQIDVSLNAARAIRTPGPQLRTDVINDGNTTAMQPARQPQIEFRPVDQNCHYRFSSFSSAFQLAESPPEFREGASHLPETHDRQLIGIHNRFDPGVPHLSSGRTEEFELDFGRNFAHCMHERCCMRVAGRLAGYDHHGNGSFHLPLPLGE
jgi:hypothetical protein